MLIIVADTKDEVKDEVVRYLKYLEKCHRINSDNKKTKTGKQREIAIANSFQLAWMELKETQIVNRG